MKSRKDFRKKNAQLQKDQDEIRIKERKRLPKNKKINKKNFHSLLEEDEDDIDFSEPQDEDEEG